MLKRNQHTDPFELVGPGCLSIRFCRAEFQDTPEDFEFSLKVSCDFSHQTFVSHSKKNCDSQQEESFHFYVGTPLPQHTVTIHVFSRDRFHSDLLGASTFKLQELLSSSGNSIKGWHTIYNEAKDAKTKSPSPKKKDIGKIYLKIHFPKDADLRGVIQHEDPKKYYTLGKTIGEGSFGTVRYCCQKKSKQSFAMKVINKQRMNQAQLELLQREIIIMSKLSHPYIVHLEEAFDTEKATCLVLELVSGGTLLNRLMLVGPYPEPAACRVMKQLLEACSYMSSVGIAHRDLKPDNILLTDMGDIKISDFGLSKDFTSSVLHSAVGTANYVAPEVLSGSEYDSACDVWSCGVICYTILSAQMPFFGHDNARVFQKILAVEYTFPDDWFGNISDTGLSTTPHHVSNNLLSWITPYSFVIPSPLPSS